MKNFWQAKLILAALVLGVFALGCNTSSMDNEGTVSLGQLKGEKEPDPTPTPDPTKPDPDPTEPSGDWPAEITGPIKWLNTDVSGWAVTATLNASVKGGTISLPYSKATSWPSVGGLSANAWAFVNVGGQWYAGTFEYLKHGQQAKPVGVVDGSLGNHFTGDPLNHWRPRSGERIGLMVSGLARSSARNVKERSNVSMVTWP